MACFVPCFYKSMCCNEKSEIPVTLTWSGLINYVISLRFKFYKKIHNINVHMGLQ